jgi:hypothetical protein
MTGMLENRRPHRTVLRAAWMAEPELRGSLEDPGFERRPPQEAG